MKLLTALKNLILIEENNNPRGTTIFSTVLNDKFIQLKSTYHQRKERHGNETYEDIVDKYNDFLYTNKSKFRQPPRFAVPDTMIKNFFSNNIDKIYNAFEKEQPKNNKIIFPISQVYLVTNASTLLLIWSAKSYSTLFVTIILSSKNLLGI